MTKKIFISMLALLAIATTAGAQVEINATNFPDEKFRNYVLGECDTDNDKKLSTAEIAAVTEIYVGSKEIANLKGIEFFTALKILECHYNALKTLDISQNTLLTSLACDDNQLSSLDVSKNTALENLYCIRNQLTGLDISKNTALKDLWCFGNKIKGTAMETLIQGLPSVSSGRLVIIDTENENEENVCTKPQVEAAKAKGWTVIDFYDRGQLDYEGSDPTSVEGIETDSGESNSRYYTLDGKRLSGEPTQKGVYINKGKKVVK